MNEYRICKLKYTIHVAVHNILSGEVSTITVTIMYHQY